MAIPEDVSYIFAKAITNIIKDYYELANYEDCRGHVGDCPSRNDFLSNTKITKGKLKKN